MTGEIYWACVDSHWDRLCTFASREAFDTAAQDVPEFIKTLFAVHWADAEISNGGIWQFLYNPGGILAPDAVRGFSAIGLPEAADLIAHCMKQLGEPYPMDTARRQELLGDDPDDSDLAFESETNRFYDIAGWDLDSPGQEARWCVYAVRFAEANGAPT